MNAIQYALNDIRNHIPPQVLNRVFGVRNIPSSFQHYQPYQDHQSVDATIRAEVIEKRVNIDCNLSGSLQVAIDLRGVPYEQIDHGTRVFRIPYEKTAMRRIVSVSSLNYISNYGIGSHNLHATGDILSAMTDLVRSLSSMPVVSTAHCQIIGDNVVMVRDNAQHISDQLAMMALIEHDQNMNDLNPGIYMLYSQLVVLATKAYIYNQMVITLDQGQLMAGQELGRIREVIDEYRDANEQYLEILTERWRKASRTNDRPWMHRAIASQFPRGRG